MRSGSEAPPTRSCRHLRQQQHSLCCSKYAFNTHFDPNIVIYISLISYKIYYIEYWYYTLNIYLRSANFNDPQLPKEGKPRVLVGLSLLRKIFSLHHSTRLLHLQAFKFNFFWTGPPSLSSSVACCCLGGQRVCSCSGWSQVAKFIGEFSQSSYQVGQCVMQRCVWCCDSQ